VVYPPILNTVPVGKQLLMIGSLAGVLRGKHALSRTFNPPPPPLAAPPEREVGEMGGTFNQASGGLTLSSS